MNRLATAAVTVAVGGVALFGVAACSQANVTAEDAYKIGCPAVDSAVAGGSVANQATLAGLRALRDSSTLDPEPQKWLDATIAVLENPENVPPEAKKLIVDGCADNGYPLRNLS
jgi:hypothetical protein